MSLESLDLTEVLALARPSVTDGWQSGFACFVQHNYHPAEVMTVEGVCALAAYIKERLETKPIGFTKAVVQLHAGDGRLAYFLQRHGLDVAAVDLKDPASAGLARAPAPAVARLAHVEQLTFDEMMWKYRPAIIIAAWPPEDDDWHSRFCKSVPNGQETKIDVPEYIIIGPSSRLLRKDFDESEDGIWRCATSLIRARARIQRSRRALPRSYPGYDKVHVDRVSRFLLHINDVNVPKYGAACCVSLRSNRALSRSRDLDSLRTPAGAPAGATICGPSSAR